jgi:hypothetical protein
MPRHGAARGEAGQRRARQQQQGDSGFPKCAGSPSARIEAGGEFCITPEGDLGRGVPSIVSCESCESRDKSDRLAAPSRYHDPPQPGNHPSRLCRGLPPERARGAQRRRPRRDRGGNARHAAPIEDRPGRARSAGCDSPRRDSVPRGSSPGVADAAGIAEGAIFRRIFNKRAQRVTEHAI